MKKILPALFILLLPVTYSCSTLQSLGYTLTQTDAASAIRQMLDIGTRSDMTGAFSKETILSTVFPPSVSKTLSTLDQLGLTSEVDRFTTTLSTAAASSAAASVPIFANSIEKLQFADAIRIIKNGGTAATDYLKSSSGDTLRRAVKPIMLGVLNEYKLNEQWNNITKPIRAVSGGKLNLDLPTLMAGAVTEAMFRKIAEKEVQVRTEAAARTTPLLQNVFSKDWNQVKN